MEFLRFGSSIPGSYWGCCACCIIQNFKVDPKAKASIQIVNGDGGNPEMRGSQMVFAGPTWHDIFKQRLRIGTFSQADMPNHAFLAILTQSQISSGYGKEWMKILKEEGFEFIRSVDNSVYSGSHVGGSRTSSHPNYIFGLFRNIGSGAMADPRKAPASWDALPDPYKGDMSPDNMVKVQKELWSKLGPAKLLTRSEVEAANAPVWLAGQRSSKPQRIDKTKPDAKKAPSPFGFAEVSA